MFKNWFGRAEMFFLGLVLCKFIILFFAQFDLKDEEEKPLPMILKTNIQRDKVRKHKFTAPKLTLDELYREVREIRD